MGNYIKITTPIRLFKDSTFWKRPHIEDFVSQVDNRTHYSGWYNCLVLHAEDTLNDYLCDLGTSRSTTNKLFFNSK